MPLPKIIAFDLGKVLVDFDYAIAARRIAGRSTMAVDHVHSFLGQSPLLLRLESGLLTRQKFFEEVRDAIGFQGTLEEFSGYFADIFTEMPATVALHTELHQRGVPTYIFSNTNDLAEEHIRRNFPFFAQFDGYILSYQIGVMKPQAGIYEALEKLTGRRGAEILYLDDRPENVAAGNARGWQTILHETPEKTRGLVEQLGLLG